MHIKAVPITPNQNPPRIFTSWDILRSWVSPFEQIWSAYLPHLVKFQLHLEALSSVVASLASPVLCHGFWYLGCACIENLGRGSMKYGMGECTKTTFKSRCEYIFKPMNKSSLEIGIHIYPLLMINWWLELGMFCFVQIKLGQSPVLMLTMTPSMASISDGINFLKWFLQQLVATWTVVQQPPICIHGTGINSPRFWSYVYILYEKMYRWLKVP